MIFISLQLNSNRPKQITEFFDNIEATAAQPEEIEVLLHIDTGDTVMEAVVAREKPLRRFHLRVLQTDLIKSYATLWKPLNALFKMTDQEAYFVANMFDEIRFETKGWDAELRKYKDYYPDGIFRLRSSQFRFRNYTDFWQCGFAPDSSAFYTRKWLELCADWTPCMGPDSFQQCVAFYMYTYNPFSPRQFMRDVAIPNLAFSGEGTNVGVSDEAREARLREDNRLWFTLMSHRIQQEAKRRAMLMNCHIMAYAPGGPEKQIVEDREKKKYVIRNSAGDVLQELSYRLSRSRILMTNSVRALRLNYYCGGGLTALEESRFKGSRMIINAYLPKLGRIVDRLDMLLFEPISDDPNEKVYHLRLSRIVKNKLRPVYYSPVFRKCFSLFRAPYRLMRKSLGIQVKPN